MRMMFCGSKCLPSCFIFNGGNNLSRYIRLGFVVFVFLGVYACRSIFPEYKSNSEQTGVPVTLNIETPTSLNTSETLNFGGNTQNTIISGTLSESTVRSGEAPQAGEVSQPQLDIFEELWGIVRNQYLYEDFNGANWNVIGEKYREQIEKGISDEEFYELMDEMVSRLNDDHSVFLSPLDVADEEAKVAGKMDYVGIGVLGGAVPERNRAVVYLIFPGSPAEKAGIKPRDSILLVNGKKVLNQEGEIGDFIRGPEGTKVILTVQSPGEGPREVLITRRRISSSIPVPHKFHITESGNKIGYIVLVSLFDKTIPNKFDTALRDMMRENDLDGLIIDNRLNSGGLDYILADILEYFTDGIVGYFVNRSGQQPFRIVGVDLFNSQEIPLVVLIGEATESFGEVFAGVLQDRDRAYLIGKTTIGNVETLWGYDFKDGSRAWIAHDTFQPFHQKNANWEKTGIIPDLIVAGSWDEYTFETDPVIQAAIIYLDEQVGR